MEMLGQYLPILDFNHKIHKKHTEHQFFPIIKQYHPNS